MVLVHVSSLVLELIKVESRLINEMRDLTSDNLIVIEGTPENEGVLWVLYELETSLISKILQNLHII